jgi:hypothetical protein
LQQNSTEQQWHEYQVLNENIQRQASLYDAQMSEGLVKPR